MAVCMGGGAVMGVAHHVFLEVLKSRRFALTATLGFGVHSHFLSLGW